MLKCKTNKQRINPRYVVGYIPETKKGSTYPFRIDFQLYEQTSISWIYKTELERDEALKELDSDYIEELRKTIAPLTGQFFEVAQTLLNEISSEIKERAAERKQYPGGFPVGEA